MTDYWSILRRIFQRNLQNVLSKGKDISDTEIEYVKIRTLNNKEYIVTTSQDFFMLCIQGFDTESKKETQKTEIPINSEN